LVFVARGEDLNGGGGIQDKFLCSEAE